MRWGFWQAVEYLGEVQRKRGNREVLFELALVEALNAREANAMKSAGRGR